MVEKYGHSNGKIREIKKQFQKLSMTDAGSQMQQRVPMASSFSLPDSKVLLISHLKMLTVLQNLWWTRNWIVNILDGVMRI